MKKQINIEPIETIILDGDVTLNHLRGLGYSLMTLSCFIVLLMFSQLLTLLVFSFEYENVFPYFLTCIILSTVYCLYLSYSMKRDFKRLLHE